MFFNKRPFLRAGLNASQVQQVQTQVSQWIESCGPEWTIDRLKNLKLLYLNRLAGRVIDVPWLSVDASGAPKGAFKPLFQQNKGKKYARRCLDALMCYTGIVLPKVTKQQEEKFFSSVCSPPLQEKWSSPGMKEAVEEVREMSSHLVFRRLTYHGMTLGRACCGLAGRSEKTGPERFVDDAKTSCFLDFLDDDPCQQVIADTLDNLYPIIFKVNEELDEEWVGKISVMQERGGKARFIAVPRASLQVATRSLGKYLMSVCRTTPWDCTHDQMAGARWAQDSLKQGKRLWSVDLSDFTNNWPLSIIVKTLEWLEVPVQDLSLFVRLATSPWRATRFHGPNKGVQNIRWTRGQPLGTYPSFPAAALSHGAVLRGFEITYGVRNSFRVLGDDVIINNPLIHRSYRTFLDRLNIPVSLSKTLESATIGEFGGFLIQRDKCWRPRKTIIPSQKNWLARKVRDIEDGLEVGCPKDYVAWIINAVYGDNSSGLPLDIRANLRYLLDDAEEKSFYMQKGRKQYWEVCAYLAQPFSGSVGSRSELETAVQSIIDRWDKVNLSVRGTLELAQSSVFTPSTYQLMRDLGVSWHEPHWALLKEGKADFFHHLNFFWMVSEYTDEMFLTLKELSVKRPWWGILRKIHKKQLKILQMGISQVRDEIAELKNQMYQEM